MASSGIHRRRPSQKCPPPSQSQAGRTILDTTCGAAVVCIGYDNLRVKQAMVDQIDKFSYCNSMFFSHPVGEALTAKLVGGTGGVMLRAYIMPSGSEAMEAAMNGTSILHGSQPTNSPAKSTLLPTKALITTQHWVRSRWAAMSRGGVSVDMLLPNIARVSPCNAYRGLSPGQTVEQYVEQLADELDSKFQELGPTTVCAFVSEPVVGAAPGCVPAVPGYFKAT
ncbi:pyridoxal phosphate-dependent transferase [Dactylonectria macrodidyma]|uniref:Pyridoxal phosphate-dependent transferase n=1 Tax=Dactylonectria macrodidyma TaxID=307937 RepID=A0A9P9FSC6_9HYPO|nr:pyridoxal phosphate-dependent transferase [Dactylonectria macrodidyma]